MKLREATGEVSVSPEVKPGESWGKRICSPQHMLLCTLPSPSVMTSLFPGTCSQFPGSCGLRPSPGKGHFRSAPPPPTPGWSVPACSLTQDNAPPFRDPVDPWVRLKLGLLICYLNLYIKKLGSINPFYLSAHIRLKQIYDLNTKKSHKTSKMSINNINEM